MFVYTNFDVTMRNMITEARLDAHKKLDWQENNAEQEEVLEETLLEEETAEVSSETVLNRRLVVYNDDYNTFDHVIDTLMEVCKHPRVQAEQCTLLIHFKGNCVVKEGPYPKLKHMREGVVKAGLSAEII